MFLWQISVQLSATKQIPKKSCKNSLNLDSRLCLILKEIFFGLVSKPEIECPKFSSHLDVRDLIWKILILVSRLLLVDLCFSSLTLCDVDYLRVDHHLHRHPPPSPSNTNQQSRSLFVRSCGMPTAPQLSITRCAQQPSAPAPTVFYCFCRLQYELRKRK